MVQPHGEPDDEERRSAERRTIHRAGLLELITANDQKHDAGHLRLRKDVREFQDRHDDEQRLIVDRLRAVEGRLDTFAATPVDISKVMFAPRVVLAIVATVLSIWVGFWGSTFGLRSDNRDILTRISWAADQRASDAKLQEANIAMIKTALADTLREFKDSRTTTDKRLDLLTLQYNELSNQMTRLTARGEK